MTLSGRKYWLIGASEGIGAALAQALDQEGAELVLSARSQDRLQELAAGMSSKTTVLPLDVTDRKAIKEAVAQLGRLDGVIYMAGAYWPMTALEWDAEQAETMAEVNFMGGLRTLGALVPDFVKADHGHVVIIGSLAGFSGLPGAIGYGAGKAALMHLGLDMQKDLKGTGVKVQIINPGYVRTRLTDKNQFSMPFIMEPDGAARRIVKAMKGNRRVVSFPWAFALIFKLRRALGL